LKFDGSFIPFQYETFGVEISTSYRNNEDHPFLAFGFKKSGKEQASMLSRYQTPEG
jgi:hypothetical protein